MRLFIVVLIPLFFSTRLCAEKIPVRIEIEEDKVVEEFGEPELVEYIEAWVLLRIKGEEPEYVLGYSIVVTLQDEAQRRFLEFSKENLGKEIKIYIGSEMISKAVLIKVDPTAKVRINMRDREKFEEMRKKIGKMFRESASK